MESIKPVNVKRILLAHAEHGQAKMQFIAQYAFYICPQQDHRRSRLTTKGTIFTTRENFNSLIMCLSPTSRCCLTPEFFSMVEADLYLINQLNPYGGYADKDPLTTKFKKTYR